MSVALPARRAFTLLPLDLQNPARSYFALVSRRMSDTPVAAETGFSNGFYLGPTADRARLLGGSKSDSFATPQLLAMTT